MIPADPETFSDDTFFNGRVVVRQPRHGYRFSVDAPILAASLPRITEPALEIGCGCGIVSLLALFHKKFPQVTGIEIQKQLADLAVENASANGFQGKMRVISADIRTCSPDFQGVDLIFSNPPFFKVHSGHLPPRPEIRLAKFETHLTLGEFLQAGAAMLAATGTIIFIYPYVRYAEVLKTAAGNGLHLLSRRLICPYVDGKPDRFVVQLGRIAGLSTEKEPLVVFKERGMYTPEMESILSGKTDD